MTGRDHSHSSWVGYAAAIWALIFAVLHLVWAAGWYVGLEQEPARKAFAKTWFMVYDLIVAGICALAVPVALALVQPWGRRLPRWLVGLLAWAGTVLLVLRGGGTIVQTVYLVAVGSFVPEWMMLWELWFYLGAVLFGLSTWRFWRAQPTLSDVR
jgi:hypothetical protein